MENGKEKLNVVIISKLRVSFEYQGKVFGYMITERELLQRERIEAFHAGYQSNKKFELCAHSGCLLNAYFGNFCHKHRTDL